MATPSQVSGCAQDKDAIRPKEKRSCCQAVPSSRTVSDIPAALRGALTHAEAEDLITKNPVTLVFLQLSLVSTPGRSR